MSDKEQVICPQCNEHKKNKKSKTCVACRIENSKIAISKRAAEKRVAKEEKAKLLKEEERLKVLIEQQAESMHNQDEPIPKKAEWGKLEEANKSIKPKLEDHVVNDMFYPYIKEQ